MHKHHIYTHAYVYVISVLYTPYIFYSPSLGTCVGPNMDTDMGTSMVMCSGRACLPCSSLRLRCASARCACPAHSPRALLARGQLENMNRRKCCKLCRQHFSLVAAAKKEEVSQLALAFILTGIFLGTLTHTHTPIHVCLTTLWHTYIYMLYLFLNGLHLN